MKIPMGSIKKQYIVFVDHKEFVKAAYDRGYEYVVNSTGIISREIIDLLRKSKKAALLLYYSESSEFPYVIESKYKRIDLINLYGLMVKDGKEKVKIESIEDAIKFFPSVEYIEKYLIKKEVILSVDYTDRCGHCHKKLRKQDLFCRYCGTQRGEGEFKPFNPYYNEICVVYGPPIRGINNIIHECPKCNFRWSIKKTGWTNESYCPKCGTDVYISYEPVETE